LQKRFLPSKKKKKLIECELVMCALNEIEDTIFLKKVLKKENNVMFSCFFLKLYDTKVLL